MDLLKRFSAELNSIKNAGHFNKKHAIKRFFLLRDFQDNYLPAQRLLFGVKLSQTKAMKAYCESKGLAYRTFVRWHVIYRTHGIEGLLPKYAMKRPSKLPIKCGKSKLKASLIIDTNNPLKCLETVQRIIEQCRMIHPEVKSKSLSLLNRYFEHVFYEHPLSLNTPLTDDEIKALSRYRAGNHKKYSRKAAAILLANRGRTLIEVIEATHVSKRTVYRWLHNFNKDRLDSIKVHIYAPDREKRKTVRQTRVIDIIHKKPSIYGINRTTWTYAAIAKAYQHEYDSYISMDMIQRIVKDTGYSWRHARKVWTSPDPEYKAKIERILEVLQGLRKGERFFFIDEVGPYRVKKYSGRSLMLKDRILTIPEHQKSRGKVQFVAALEAVTNQLTWIFTDDKSASSVVRLIERLTLLYMDSESIFLTWDAISVHGAKAVMEWITAHNKATEAPQIHVVPLPSKSQFLNVIESVFGGMKKAVICNSDYVTALEMQEAIARHFEERNQYYRDNPKRAGNKIWDKQTFDVDRLAGGLFKKM
ncbi:MAG TPA: IS630 family transposase [Geobacteraceae bacterium]